MIQPNFDASPMTTQTTTDLHPTSGLDPGDRKMARRYRVRHAAQPGWCVILVLMLTTVAPAADQPIATIAVVSNPYITTLSADEIQDERGASRGFLAQTGPESMARTVDLVNRLQPDAVVILGSQTWSGSEADFSAAAKFVQELTSPVFTTPGHRDRAAGSLEQYLRHFGAHDASLLAKDINGVRLIFANDLHRDPDAAVTRIKAQLSSPMAPTPPQAVLLFGGKAGDEFSRSKLTHGHPTFWPMITDQRVAVRFEPTRYSHQVAYENNLPVWTVGSTAWSARGAVSVVRVFPESIELAEITDRTQPHFSLDVPNPVRTTRLPTAASDPYGCPTYSANLAKKPDFTFALVSDPQFDRVRNRDTLISRATAAIDELNRLKPATVFIAGDLVNNNLPEEWELFGKTFGQLNPPWHAAPGNHDVLFNYDFVEASYANAATQNPFDPATTLLIDDTESVLESARRYGVAHLLTLLQPDSSRQMRIDTQFPGIHHFDEIMPAETNL